MITDRTTPSETVTREPDDVGKPGNPAVAGGRQSAEQAAITDMGAPGKSDADRREEHGGPQNHAGSNPVPPGGSSGGHSDRVSASGTGEKVAGGRDGVEKRRD